MATTAQKRASAERRAENRKKGEGEEWGHTRVRAKAVVAGRCSKVTRRTVGRQMLLAPGPPRDARRLSNFVGYCLAVAAKKYGVEVHAGVVMSNHHHLDVCDRSGQLPDFKRWFHSAIARGVNALRGRRDTFWGGGGGCDTTRPDDETSLMDLVYTLTNPVETGLVKRGGQWPGFTTHGWRFGETRVFKRPDWFFDAEGELPDEVELCLVRPPVFEEELSDDEVYELLMEKVQTREREIRKARRGQGRKFMGVRKLQRQSWRGAPKSFEKWFTTKPTVAGTCKWRVLAQLQRDRVWEAAYAKAREAFRSARKSVAHQTVFPAGTYWMRRFIGVAVAANAPP